jgi:hypothetical protein
MSTNQWRFVNFNNLAGGSKKTIWHADNGRDVLALSLILKYTFDTF